MKHDGAGHSPRWGTYRAGALTAQGHEWRRAQGPGSDGPKTDRPWGDAVGCAFRTASRVIG
jgi:hypothetical protein